MIAGVSNSSQIQTLENKPVVTTQSSSNSHLIPTVGTTNTDSVQLSAKAEAAALQQRGFTVGEIASKLDVTTQTVDGYLRINPSASATLIPSATGNTKLASSSAAGGTAVKGTVQTDVKQQNAENSTSSNGVSTLISALSDKSTEQTAHA